MLSVMVAAIFSACSKDDPFGNETSEATGGFLTAALDVSLNSEFGPRSVKNRNVRAAAPDIDLFRVDFYLKGSDIPVKSYSYKDMPEIVTLPVGTYYAVASYGTNPVAAWDSPYYEGRSDEFRIVADEILAETQKIECKISNVRVSVEFTPELRKVVENDCHVVVEVGQDGSLDFELDAIDNGKSGYFRYVDNSQTLGATFEGTVDGAFTREVKTSIAVLPGHYYAILFRLHDAGEEDPGHIAPGDDGSIVIVDATVTTEDIEWNADSDDSVIEDDMRPSDGGSGSGGEDPNPGPGPDEPNVPDTPDEPTGDAPSITAKAPINIEAENLIDFSSEIELYISTEADGGIKAFTVDIDSNVLTADALGDMFPTHLDLVNPGADYEGNLRDLNFPVKEQVNGQKFVTFNMTEFVAPMLALGMTSEAPKKYYNFILTVTDSNGKTSKKTLKLYHN